MRKHKKSEKRMNKSVKKEVGNYTHYCQTHNIPYFYAQQPEDLICSTSYLTLNGKKGEIKKGLCTS